MTYFKECEKLKEREAKLIATIEKLAQQADKLETAIDALINNRNIIYENGMVGENKAFQNAKGVLSDYRNFKQEAMK